MIVPWNDFPLKTQMPLLISFNWTAAYWDATGDGHCITQCWWNQLRDRPMGQWGSESYRGTLVLERVRSERCEAGTLTWWVAHCRWGSCGDVCLSKTGTMPKCCAGCQTHWSGPGYSTPPVRLMPHGCLKTCSTESVNKWRCGDKQENTRVAGFSIYICGSRVSYQILPCRPGLQLPVVSVVSSQDYSHVFQTVDDINHILNTNIKRFHASNNLQDMNHSCTYTWTYYLPTSSLFI